MSIEKKYTWFAAAVIGLFVIFTVLIFALADGGRMCAGSSAGEPVFVEYTPSAPQFAERSCYMTPRSTKKPELAPDENGERPEVTGWSTSDATVARVDSEGSITALADGTAVITALTPSGEAKLTVFVADDMTVAAADCVRTLSLGCTESQLRRAELLLEQMAQDGSGQSEAARNLLQNIVSYTEKGDPEALEDTIAASGMDADLCRTAAVCCWVYGQRTSCDALLSFAGDCTLARFNEQAGKGRFPHTYAASGSPTYPFDRVRGIFAADDLTLVNLEGALTRSKRHKDKEFFFRGDPEYASILTASSIEGAVLANNHSMDYHRRGYDDTVYYLGEAGVAAAEEDAPARFTVGGKGISVAVLSANLVGTDRDKALEGLLTLLKKHKTDRTLAVVSLHWGTEGAALPEKWQREAARRLIDSGADLIVGHHPHVVQGIEIYNGKYIAYSLGNFAFGGNMTASSPETFILQAQVTADENGVPSVSGISVLPCLTTSTGNTRNNYRPTLAFGSKGGKVHSLLMERSEKLEDGVSGLRCPEV